jgi:hypothetical protein
MCRSLLGLPRVEAFVVKSALLFLGRLCTLDEGELSKEVFLRRLCQAKLQEAKLSVVHKRSSRVSLGICEFVCKLLDVHDLSVHLERFLQTGQFVSKMVWKKIVTNQLINCEYEAFEERVQSDMDFANFVMIHPDCFSPSMAWQVAKYVPNSRKIMRFAVTLITTTSTQELTLCEYCGRVFTSALTHHCTVCCASDTERELFWDFLNSQPRG